MNKTQMAVDVFDKNAKAYQDKFMNVDLYQEALDVLCHGLEKKEASILELACGPGNVTRYLLNKRPDFKVTGTDLAVSMLELAKLNNPSATFQLMDCRDLHKIKDKYDALVCSFCLPYVSKDEALKMIHDGYKILNPNGLIYLSTMEDDYGKSGLETSSAGNQLYMHYHQADYLLACLTKEGYELIHQSRKSYTDAVGKPVTDLMLVARKK